MSVGESGIYLVTFFSLLAAGLGFPIPEEIPIVGAGAYAGSHVDNRPRLARTVASLLAFDPQTSLPAAIPWSSLPPLGELPDQTSAVRWWLLLTICILGVVLSDGLLYCLGRVFGTRLLDLPFMKRFLSDAKRERIEKNFHRSGIKILLFARFMPGIRAPIFITAGIMRLPLHRFLLADGLYAIPGVSLLFFLAFWFTNSFVDLVVRVENHVVLWRPLVIMLLIIGLAGFLLFRYWRRLQANREGVASGLFLDGPEPNNPLLKEKTTGGPQ